MTTWQVLAMRSNLDPKYLYYSTCQLDINPNHDLKWQIHVNTLLSSRIGCLTQHRTKEVCAFRHMQEAAVLVDGVPK